MRNLSRSLRSGAKAGTSYPSIVIDKIRDRVSVRLSTNGAIYRNLKLVGGPVAVGQLVYTDFTTPEPTVVAPGIDYSRAFEELARMEEDVPLPPIPPGPVYESNMIEVYQRLYWMRNSNGTFTKIGTPEYFPVTSDGLQGAIEACHTFGAIFIPDTDIAGENGIEGDYDFWYYQAVIGAGRDKTKIFGQTTWRNGFYVEGATLENDTDRANPGQWIVGCVFYGDGFFRDVNVLCYNKGPSSGSGIGFTNTELTTTWIMDSVYIKADIGMQGNLYGGGEGIDYSAQAEIGYTWDGASYLPEFPAGGYDYMVDCRHGVSKHDIHFYGKYFEMSRDYFHVDAAALVLKSTLYSNPWEFYGGSSPCGGFNPVYGASSATDYDRIDMWWLCEGNTAQEEYNADPNLYPDPSSASNGSNFGEKNMYRSGYGKQMMRYDCEGHFIQDQSFWHWYLNGLADPIFASQFTPQIPFQARVFWDAKDAANPQDDDGAESSPNYGPGDMIHFTFDGGVCETYTDPNTLATIECQEQGVGSFETTVYTPDGIPLGQTAGSGFPAGQVPRMYVDWRYFSQKEYSFFWLTRAGGLRGMQPEGRSAGSSWTAGEYVEPWEKNGWPQQFADWRLCNRDYAITLKPKYMWMTRRESGQHVWYLPTLFNGRMTNCLFNSSWIDIDARVYSFVVVDQATQGSLFTTLGTVVSDRRLNQPVFNPGEPSDPFPYEMWFPQPY